MATVATLTGLGERLGPRWPLTIGPIVTRAGFALLIRANPQASYWTSILPGTAVIALGMAGAIAPLTAAVLSSVNGRHTGTASGFNSAIARTGGLIPTALAGAVIAVPAAEIASVFHIAALVAAGFAGTAGIVVFLTLDRWTIVYGSIISNGD